MLENILDVKVPDELRVRVLSGLEWFDKVVSLEGGFVPSIVHMLSGMQGAGKSTLLRQVADGLMKNGHLVIYNSGEESAEQIAMSIERMKLERGFYVTNFRSSPDLIKAANKLAAENPGKRVVLIQDSLQKMDCGKYKDGGINGKTAGRVMQQFLDWAKKTKHIVVFVCQVNKDGKFKGNNNLAHDLDVQIELKYNEQMGRWMKVTKNRFGRTFDRLPYEIQAKGLVPLATVDEAMAQPEDDDGESAEKPEKKTRRKRRSKKNKVSHLTVVK